MGNIQNRTGRRGDAQGEGTAPSSAKPEAVSREWWAKLTLGERRLICGIMGMLRGAKRSQIAEVARAAAKWERGIGCFIKVRLMSGGSATGTRSRRQQVESKWLKVEGATGFRRDAETDPRDTGANAVRSASRNQ